MVRRIDGAGGTEPIDPNKKAQHSEANQSNQANANAKPTSKKLPETSGVNPNYNQAMIQQFENNQAVAGAEDSVPANLDDGLGVDGIDTATRLDRIANLDLNAALAELQSPEVREALLTGNSA